MLTLALDTATTNLSVALVQDQKILAEINEPADRSHAERLPVVVAELLETTKLSRSQINLVAVGVGPGTYTGLRVGLMFAIAFAKALNIETVGICSHDAIASKNFNGFVVTDAKRKEVYVSQYRSGKRILGPIVRRPDSFEFGDAEVMGDGVSAHLGIFQFGSPTPISAGLLGQKVNADYESGNRPASVQPEVGSASSDGSGALPSDIGLLLPPLPLYLRRPDVMEPK